MEEKGQEAFWFWKEDKPQHLLALFKAYNISVGFIFRENIFIAASANYAAIIQQAIHLDLSAIVTTAIVARHSPEP